MEKKESNKPTCPFCGSDNIRMFSGKDRNKPYAYAFCGFCKARGPVRSTAADAVKEWAEVSRIVKEYYDDDNEDD